MSRRSVLAEALSVSLSRRRRGSGNQTGEGIGEDAAPLTGDQSEMTDDADHSQPAAEPAGSAAASSTLAEIFDSIRTGQTPWTLDQLPEDTGATTVLLSELDRLWQNPE